VSLVVAFNAHLGIVSGDVRCHLLVVARLCGAEHDCLVAGGVLGGDATWLLERASDEVALFALGCPGEHGNEPEAPRPSFER
jgi:hypothetical protein